MQNIKKLQFKNQLVCRQDGQAVVEYVLVLIVTVSLLLAFKGVVTGIDKFMYSFMGEYISCLMEYGELPSAGIKNSALDQHKSSAGGGKVCDSSFAPFTLAAGRPPSANGSGSGANKQAGSKNSSQTAGSSSNPSQAETKSNNKDKSSDSSTSNSSSTYANGKIQRAASSSTVGTADNGKSSGDDKVKIIADEGDSGKQWRRDSAGIKANRTVYQRSRYKAITGKEQEEIEKQNKSIRAPTSQVLGAIDENGRIAPRKSIFTPPETKPALVNNSEDGEMNFGYFMKWLIIAAMLIAIFLFFGSQAMGFMNSQEK